MLNVLAKLRFHNRKGNVFIHRLREFVLLVALLALPLGCHAAIGIYNWYPSDVGRYKQISYRLNTQAVSGQVRIRSQANGELTKTIPLTGELLSRGAHSVAWVGDKESGFPASSGAYYAEISVTAASVSADPNNASKNRHDIAYFPGTAARYYGIAVDSNPANNNQDNPTSSTYGLIYAANSLEGTIEVYYPDQWSDALPSGRRITPKAVINARTAGNQLAPWGISVGQDGRIYSTGRANGPQQGFWNYSADGASWKFAAQGTASEDTMPIGSVQNSTAFQLRASDNRVERVRILGDYSYLDGLPGDSSRVADNVLTGAASSIFSLAANPTGVLGSGPLWITTPGANPSVRRYLWNGIAYTLDPAWSIPVDVLAPGSSATGVDIHPNNPGVLAVSCQRSTNNLLIMNSDSGAIDGSYQPVAGIIRSVHFDSVGNVYLDSEGATKSSRQARLSVFFPSDSGSSDMRVTKTFNHTSGNMPPVVQSADQSKTAIKENDSDSVELLVDVSDNDGVLDISSVQVDLSALGYSNAVLMIADVILSPTSRRYRLSGIKAKSTTPAGLLVFQVTPRDSVGSGVPFPVYLQIVGGTITGTVKHRDGLFSIGNATVVLTDTVSGNVYSTVSSASADSKGCYSIQVNPGNYSVSALKSFYGPAAVLTSISVKQDQVRPSINPLLTGTTASEVASAPDGAEVCVQAVVSAAAYRSSPPIHLEGFSNDDGRSLTKFYLRDPCNPFSGPAGIAVLNDSFKAYRGHLVVVEGVKLAQIGFEPVIASVTAFLDQGRASGAQWSDVSTLSALTQNSTYSTVGDW
ncbi:MAG: FlgD immunoglobulin-like domain containing protein, partial [Armatimonadota bacterium]